MSHNNVLILAWLIAALLIGIGTRFSASWPWYACAAIILAGCAYGYLKSAHWLSGWKGL